MPPGFVDVGYSPASTWSDSACFAGLCRQHLFVLSIRLLLRTMKSEVFFVVRIVVRIAEERG